MSPQDPGAGTLLPVALVKVFADRAGNWHGQIAKPDGSSHLFAPASLEEAVEVAEALVGRELEWTAAPTGTVEGV